MKKAKSISLALAAVMGLSLCGCAVGGGRDQNTDIEELVEHSGKITVWWPGSSKEMAPIEQAKADYIALYPDVEIEIVGQSTPDFYPAYLLACTGNSAPDIAYVDHVFVQTLAFDGYISNLSSVGYDELEDTFVDTLWEPGFYEGKLYGLPMSANVLVTVYNKTLIARAQNTTADSVTLPKNFDELLELCSQIYALNDASTASDPYYGITIPAGNNHESMAAMSYLAFVNRSGGEGILSADMKTSLFNSQACVDAATKMFELGEYAPSSFSEAKFESGRIGFIEMGPWKIEDYAKYSANYGWEVGYTTAIPFTEGGNNGSTIGLYDLVISNERYTANHNAALAADFAKFVATNDKYQLAFSTAQNLIPTTRTGVQDEFYAGDVWQVFIEQLESAVVRPGSPAWADIEEILGTFVTGLVQHTTPSDKSGVAQECAGIHEQVRGVLEEIYMD